MPIDTAAANNADDELNDSDETDRMLAIDAGGGAGVEQTPLLVLSRGSSAEPTSSCQRRWSEDRLAVDDTPPPPTDGDSYRTNLAPTSSVDKLTSFNETLLNFIKANIGTGILAIPDAFRHSGIAAARGALKFAF